MTTKNGKAATVKKLFSRQTTVSVSIKADTSIIWALLTNANDYSRWNTTIVSLKGVIEKEGRIELVSTLDPKRVFKLKVKEFNPDHFLSWGDAMGTRKFIIQRVTSDESNFTMTEQIGGPFFPLFASFIPSFDVSFETFAADLKREAEAITKTK